MTETCFEAEEGWKRCRRLEKGFDAMMSDMRVPDLARLYNLCGRIHALEPLRAAFRAYIKKAGLALIMDEEKVCDGTLLAALQVIASSLKQAPAFQVALMYNIEIAFSCCDGPL